MSSAYFHKILRELHRQTKAELASSGIALPKKGRAELERINRELKKEVLK